MSQTKGTTHQYTNLLPDRHVDDSTTRLHDLARCLDRRWYACAVESNVRWLHTTADLQCGGDDIVLGWVDDMVRSEFCGELLPSFRNFDTDDCLRSSG